MFQLASTGKFKCEDCDHIFDIHSEWLDIQQTGAHERDMGSEVFYTGEFEMECPRCNSNIEIFYEASEYPVGMPNFDETTSNGAIVINSFSPMEMYYEDALYNLDEKSLLFVPEQKTIITDLYSGVSSLLHEVNKVPDMIYGIDPREFEELIAHIFHLNGFKVELTKKTGDGGRDIIAIRSDLDIRSKYLIECKRYAPNKPVSINLVRSLYGVQQVEGANKSVLATTSRFTSPAMQFAKTMNTSEWAMDLKDINDIRGWISTAATLQ